MDDASLDEFVEDAPPDGSADAVENEQATDGDDESADNSERDEGGGSATPAAPDPATATSRWVPAGEACDDCGTTVSRQWREDGWVCQDCKEW